LRDTARAAVDQATDANLFFGRLDHYLNDADRFFARLAWDESGQNFARINPNFPAFVDARSVNLATSWTHAFSQNAINDFRFGVNIADDELAHPRTNDERFSAEDLGIGSLRVVSDGNRPLGRFEAGVPTLGGLPFLFGDNFGNTFNYADTLQVADHVSLIRGSHNLKFGAEYHYVALERDASAHGALNFGSNESGLPFASFLLGLPAQTVSPLGLSQSDSRANRLGIYAQDDWKLNSRITLNLGLRVDYNGNPVDRGGLWRSVNFCGEELPGARGPGCYTDPNTGIGYPTVGPDSIGPGGDIKLWKQDVRFFMLRPGAP
jgi:outer membrane receptor protein involved in Fe transport